MQRQKSDEDEVSSTVEIIVDKAEFDLSPNACDVGKEGKGYKYTSREGFE